MKVSDHALQIKFPYWRRYFFALAVLLTIIFLSYSNSFNCAWHWDDYANINENKKIQIKEFTWDNIKEISYGLTKKKISRPVSYVSFAVNYYFDGFNVFGYHLINLLIHFLSSVFLFLFIINTLKLPLLKDKYEENAYSIALLATIIWAINPVHVTAVTYIVQRMASMAGLFYIMAMFFYLKFRTSPSTIKYIHILSCLICMVLAIGSKENAAMLPASIFLYDLFLIQGLTWPNIKKNIKIAFIAIIVIFAAGALFFDFSSIFNSGGYEHRPFTMYERLLTEPRVILFYISLLFYPLTSRLTLIHDITISKGLLEPWTTLAAIIVITFIIAVSLVKSKKWPLFTYCILFFFLNHLIEGSFIPLELIYEHRNYLPSMLLFIPVSVGIVTCLEYCRQKKKILYLLATSITVIIIVMSVTVYMQNNIMQDELTLWTDNAKKSPRLHTVHHNLGVALFYSGRLTEAFEEFEKSLTSFFPADGRKIVLTYRWLGECNYIMGNDDKAIEWFNKAITGYHKAFYMAHCFNRLADIYLRKNKLDTAEKMVLEAIAIEPSIAKYYQTYSVILKKQNRPDEAIKQEQKALRLSANFTDKGR